MALKLRLALKENRTQDTVLGKTGEVNIGGWGLRLGPTPSALGETVPSPTLSSQLRPGRVTACNAYGGGRFATGCDGLQVIDDLICTKTLFFA